MATSKRGRDILYGKLTGDKVADVEYVISISGSNNTFGQIFIGDDLHRRSTVSHSRVLTVCLTCLLMSSGHLSAADADDSKWAPRVEIAASGGFAGITEVTVLTVPNLVCPAATTNTPTPTCTVDPDHVLAIKNVNHTWKPATSTGIIFRWVFYKFQNDENNDGIGAGFGVHFVFVPTGTETRAAPALTGHFGKKNLQFFMGWIFVATDKVEFPPNTDQIAVPTTFQTNSLIGKDGGREGTFFAGIVIGAVSVTKPSSLLHAVRLGR